MDEKDKSPHILNASSNLLGLCFVVLTSLKILRVGNKTIIDELTLVAIIFFMSSCFLSFLSIRGSIRSKRYEDVADYLFLSGIILLFLTAILFSVDAIN